MLASASWDALDVKFTFQFPSETAVIMSFLDANSFTRSWSFLPIFNELDDDPYRSRNTIAHAQQAYQRNLFRESTFQRSLGEGAVFKVSLYLHNTRGQLYAVKKAKLGHSDKSNSSGKKNSSAGIFAVFKEIQVVSHTQLKKHPNVVDIIGWDWANDQAPVVFVEYSAPGSLQQFLISSTKVGPGVRRNLALDIACGLHGLHSADVAHGDVKLANTLVFPDPCREWKAKISDFSHAIFGISLRRRSSYPGSGLYNAPEVRKRDAIIISDRLPCCETFSFGLLVWEILLQGKPFSTCLPLYKPIHSAESSEPNLYLESQKENELLRVALNSISCAQELSITERATFHQVLSMTLKDQPGRRHDMQLVTSALDHTDRFVQQTLVQFCELTRFSSGLSFSNSQVEWR
jgi:serine/threonine protein kinase